MPIDLGNLKKQQELTLEQLELSVGLRCPGCRRRFNVTTGCVEWMWVELADTPEGRVPALRQGRTCKDDACVAHREAAERAWTCEEHRIVWLDSAPTPDLSAEGGGPLMGHLGR